MSAVGPSGPKPEKLVCQSRKNEGKNKTASVRTDLYFSSPCLTYMCLYWCIIFIVGK